MAKVKTLYQNGQQIMPVTHPKAVMDENGETLEAKLSKINKRLDACGNGGSMSGQLVGSASGTSVSVSDALAAPLIGLRVFGKSTQDGTPMPTAPAPITSAGGSGTVTVRLTGENLLNPSLFQDGQYQNFDSNSANFGIVTNSNYWITGLQPCVPGTAYHISHAFSGGCFYNESQQPLGAISVGESFRTPAKCGYFCLNFEKSTVAFGGQVSAALGDAVYAPYTEQTLPLQTPNALPGIPVSSGGNYTDENGQQWVCDEVDLARGVRVQRITKIKLTSSMKWTKAGNNVDRYFCTFDGIDAAGTFCTHFSAAINGETVGGIATSSSNIIGFAYAERGTTSVDDFKAFLDANEVYIYVPLATPVETALSSAEIAAYKALTTYAPTTTISVSDGAGATATYQRDAILVIKRLEEAIASTTAVSSLSM
jgi:hypothetical protein|nr:MAG TPA: hypothetical protein [Caudoviricetes sp.]